MSFINFLGIFKAVYNLLSYLWEIETGSVYRMLKEHDIFSGLGTDSEKRKDIEISSAEAQAQEDIKDAGKSKSDVAEASLATAEEMMKLSDLSPNDVSRATQAPEVPSEEQQMNDLARDIRRAECIAETLDQIKVIYYVFITSMIKSKYISNY